VAYRWNPVSGQLDLVRPTQTTVETAEKIADTFDCDATALVGDVVTPSETVENKVESLAGNVYNGLAFGIIIEKLSLTTCKVLISGKLTGATYNLAGLTYGKALFVGTDGTITTTTPTTGHRQKMGMAIKSDTIFLLPSLEKVILS
jgi:hypothetical protein